MEGEGDERQALMEDLLEQKGEKFVEGAIVEDGQLLDASEAETRYFQGTEGLVKVFVRQGTLSLARHAFRRSHTFTTDPTTI